MSLNANPRNVKAFYLEWESVLNIHRTTIFNTKSNEQRAEHWDSCLGALSVQWKFSDVCSLKRDNRVWNRIVQGLLARQLSLLLQAAFDTTPLNLMYWRCKPDATCYLCCSVTPTTLHILNGCPTTDDSRQVCMES